MKEKKNKSSERGLVTAGGPVQALDAAVTWHDVPPLRIWVGSRVLDGGSGVRVAVSIDFQFMGETHRDPSVAERKARLELLNVIHANPNHRPDLDAITIRQFPVGSILEEHSQLIGEQVFKYGSPDAFRLNMVSDVTTFSSRRDSKTVRDGQVREVLSNSNSDNILIAYVYAQQFAAGATKLSKRTAELLGIDVSVVHVALKIARRNGWITSEGAGKSGGHLTELGELMFQNYDGPRRYEKLVIVG
jgi:hypothetical protein